VVRGFQTALYVTPAKILCFSGGNRCKLHLV